MCIFIFAIGLDLLAIRLFEYHKIFLKLFLICQYFCIWNSLAAAPTTSVVPSLDKVDFLKLQNGRYRIGHHCMFSDFKVFCSLGYITVAVSLINIYLFSPVLILREL